MPDRAMLPSLAERSRDWYQRHARGYDRRHTGLPGDRAFYAGLASERVVLEIGAGTGRVTEALAAVARLVIAVDYASAMLQRACGRLAHRPNVHLVLADARLLPLAGAFECIVLPYRVIHHLEPDERLELWRSLAALLADDGLIAFDSWHGPPAGRSRSQTEPPVTQIALEAAASEPAAVGLVVTNVSDGFCQDDRRASFTRVWILRKRAFVQKRTFTNP